MSDDKSKDDADLDRSAPEDRGKGAAFQGRKPPRAYEVGHGRPPPQHRFRKGASGNPSGGSKAATGKKALREALEKVLRQKKRSRSAIARGWWTVTNSSHKYTFRRPAKVSVPGRIFSIELLMRNLAQGLDLD
jgi:hypothetical protein